MSISASIPSVTRYMPRQRQAACTSARTQVGERMSIASFDVIVVGAGPAGLTAATGAARAGLKAFCLDKLAPGGALINLAELHEVERAMQMARRSPRSSPTRQRRPASSWASAKSSKLIGSGPWTRRNRRRRTPHRPRCRDRHRTQHRRTLGLPEEAEYDGRGLSHCASCDGLLYAGRPVVVAGTEGWAPHEAAELQVVAGEVTVIGKPAASLPRRRPSPRRPHRRSRRR